MIAFFIFLAVHMNVLLVYGPTLIMSPSSAGPYTVTDYNPYNTKLSMINPNSVCEWKRIPIDGNNLFGGSLNHMVAFIALV